MRPTTCTPLPPLLLLLLTCAVVVVPTAAAAVQADSCAAQSASATLCDISFPLGANASVRANNFTADGQLNPDVARLVTGEYVVVWQSEFQDGSFDGVYAAVFAPNGSASVPEFRVNAFTNYSQRTPRVASFRGGGGGGGFIVTWVSEFQDGSAEGVYARVFDNRGNATTAAGFAVTTTTSQAQTAPDVAAISATTAVIVWQSDLQDGAGEGVYGRAFSLPSGAAVSSEMRINSEAQGSQRRPRIASAEESAALHIAPTAASSTYFIVTWESVNTTAGAAVPSIVQGRAFASFTQPLSAHDIDLLPSRVNGSVTRAAMPTVLSARSNDVVVVFEGVSADSGHEEIYLRGLSASLQTGRSGVLRVSSGGADDGRQLAPVVAELAESSFAVLWESNDGSSSGISVQLFNASLAPALAATRLNWERRHAQQRPAAVGMIGVTSAEQRQLVGAWHSDFQDGSGKGVYTRIVRYGPPPPVVCEADEVISHYGAAFNASCDPLMACRRGLCTCVGSSSTETAVSLSSSDGNATAGWTCLRQPLTRLSCSLQPLCVLAFRQCVDLAAATTRGAPHSLGCRVWAQLHRGAVAGVDGNATAYATSSLRQSCAATVCGIWRHTNSRCPYAAAALDSAICRAPTVVDFDADGGDPSGGNSSTATSTRAPPSGPAATPTPPRSTRSLSPAAGRGWSAATAVLTIVLPLFLGLCAGASTMSVW